MSRHLAKALWTARTTGGVIAVGADQRPANDVDAYAIQAEVTALFGSAVVGCRVEGGLTSAGPLLIADGAANVAVIPGEPVADWRKADLSDQRLKVEVNGVAVASGSSNLLMWGNPFGAVSHLASHPQVGERGLCAGDRIMTGTCGGVLPLKSGDRATADFGVLGSVRLKVA